MSHEHAGHGHGHGPGEHTHTGDGTVEDNTAHRHQAAPVLDIGGTVGALVVYTAVEDDEREIDISAGTDPAAPRTHNQVHPRRAPAGTVYSAVYPELEQGEYTLWRDRDSPHGTVTIRGGEVTEYDWN